MMRTIISKAPGRISFAGGGTDLISHFYKYGGAVVSSSINLYTTTTLRNYDFKNNIYTISDIPKKSGLGGSSAHVVSLLGALYRQFGRTLSKEELAVEAVKFERENLGIAGGLQDQYASVYGGFNFITFSSKGVKVMPLNIKEDALEDLQSKIYLLRMKRVSEKLHVKMEKTINEKESIFALNQTHTLAWKLKHQLENGDTNISDILKEGWELKKISHPDITNRKIEDFFKNMEKQDAYGKLCGAGGFAILYSEKKIKNAIPFKFEKMGAHVIERI